jgi:plastocyanin
VTFGVLPDHSNQPMLVDPGKGFTLITSRPCVSTQAVTATTTNCPGAPEGWAPPAGTPAPEVSLPIPYAGEPFYNSGIFLGGQTVVLPLAHDIEPGAYRFICLIHPTMMATLTVVPAGSPTQTADALASAADRQLTADRTDASTIFASLPVPPAVFVNAGAVGKEVSLNQFFPTTLSITVGQTVTWRNDSYEPHALVLGRRMSPEDPLVFGRPTPSPGSDYAGGVVVSGLFAGRSYAPDSYSLRFTRPGTYTYICPIHPGRAGVVEVN